MAENRRKSAVSTYLLLFVLALVFAAAAVLLLPVILLWKWERASTVLLCIFISFLTVAGVGFEYGYTIRCGYNRDSLRRELDIVRNYLTHTPFPQELLDRMKAPDQHGNIADWNQ